MGDSACLMHAFSYASAIPNEAKQGNRMHALGESISFGRFTNESLAWDKWSTFSHKRYVEEAERYAKPGSVAQKKAFFEAHFKRIAAQKAAAAALLEQSNATPSSNTTKQDHDAEITPNILTAENAAPLQKGPLTPVAAERELTNVIVPENKETISGSELTQTSHTDKPLLKVKATSDDAPKRPMRTPSSENRSMTTPIHPTASGSQTAGPKWNILSAVCPKSFTACRNKLESPSLSTPFLLRTEERAARRKQKLEEKFNAKEVHKVQLQTKLKEKAEMELRKLQQSFCFRARPLPKFYKERETTKNYTKKTPVKRSQSPKPGTKPSKSTMASQPPSTYSTKKRSYKNSGKKNSSKPLNSQTLPTVVPHDQNASPNIQHQFEASPN